MILNIWADACFLWNPERKIGYKNNDWKGILQYLMFCDINKKVLFCLRLSGRHSGRGYAALETKTKETDGYGQSDFG